MTIEQIPIVLGVLVALIGIGLVVDAVLPEQTRVFRERRRRMRTERNRTGEALVGLGTVCMALALIGRDTWDFGTVSVIIGAVLLAIGAWQNREYMRELIAFRGPARRGAGDASEGGRPRVPTTPSAGGTRASQPGPVAHADRAAQATERAPAPPARRPPVADGDGASVRAAASVPRLPLADQPVRPTAPPAPARPSGRVVRQAPGRDAAPGGARGAAPGHVPAERERPIPMARERGGLDGAHGDGPDEADRDGGLRGP